MEEFIMANNNSNNGNKLEPTILSEDKIKDWGSTNFKPTEYPDEKIRQDAYQDLRNMAITVEEFISGVKDNYDNIPGKQKSPVPKYIITLGDLVPDMLHACQNANIQQIQAAQQVLSESLQAAQSQYQSIQVIKYLNRGGVQDTNSQDPNSQKIDWNNIKLDDNKLLGVLQNYSNYLKNIENKDFITDPTSGIKNGIGKIKEKYQNATDETQKSINAEIDKIIGQLAGITAKAGPNPQSVKNFKGFSLSNNSTNAALEKANSFVRAIEAYTPEKLQSIIDGKGIAGRKAVEFSQLKNLYHHRRQISRLTQTQKSGLLKKLKLPLKLLQL